MQKGEMARKVKIEITLDETRQAMYISLLLRLGFRRMELSRTSYRKFELAVHSYCFYC